MQQPLQQTLPSTGLSALSSVAGAGGGGCPSTLRWPPSTTLLQPTALGGGPVYGTYLTPLNSLTDPNSFSASAILAAAAALQHNNLPGHGLLSTSSSLTGGSTYSHESMLSKSCKNGDTSTVFTSELDSTLYFGTSMEFSAWISVAQILQADHNSCRSGCFNLIFDLQLDSTLYFRYKYEIFSMDIGSPNFAGRP
ncbi:unnamed protein product [Trichobilharzia regenti]|nr:unnamed protein product [Trichobilharzia regenti]